VKKNSLLDGGQFALGFFIGLVVVLLVVVFGGYIGARVFENETLFGAVLGGFLSGSAALAATILANYLLIRRADQLERQEREAILIGILVKIVDFNDTVTKSYRHYFDSSPDLSLYIGQLRLPKPLLYSRAAVEFTQLEKGVAFSLRNATLLNDLVDVERMSYSLNGLLNDYRISFEAIVKDTLKSQPPSINGRQVSGEFVVNPVELLEIDSYKGHLLSALLRDFPKMQIVLQNVISVLREDFGRNVEYKVEDVPAQADNFFA
jgi:hypothetical protein